MTKEKLTEELNDIQSLQQCADQFGVMGDVTKLRICWLLCKYDEITVGKIAEILQMEQSRVSHALKKLKKSGLVLDRKVSTSKFYSLKDTPLCSFIKDNIN